MWLTNWLRKLLFPEDFEMLQKIEQLQQLTGQLTSQVADLEAKVAVAVSNATALKDARDAAVSDNGQLRQQIAVLQEQIAQLQASALSAEDEAALDATKSSLEGALAGLQQVRQDLGDSNTVNAPGN